MLLSLESAITAYEAIKKEFTYVLAEKKIRGKEYDLKPLRAILSTGSPLSVEGFEFVYREVKEDLQLASISGGSDINGCFAAGNPMGPVYAGELQCRCLAMDVEAFGYEGKPVRNEQGELVCLSAAPPMPIYFWEDPKGEKYHNAYFDVYPGVWRHGDFIEEALPVVSYRGLAGPFPGFPVGPLLADLAPPDDVVVPHEAELG